MIERDVELICFRTLEIPNTAILKPDVGIGQANFFSEVRKSQIPKFLGAFHDRKSANFVSVPMRTSQIQNFLWLIRNSPQSRLRQRFFVQIWIRALYAIL